MTNSVKMVSLGDENLFELAIGRRKTKSELLALPKGDVPIISARLDKPFGFIQSDSFVCIKKKIVLWNIDSSRWDTRYLEEGTKFIPTDHCGYMKVLSKQIVPEYIAYKLYEQGLNSGFKHEYRASLKNIRDISIPIPTNKKGQFDVRKQKAISSKYYKYINARTQFEMVVDDLSKQRLNISSSAQFVSVAIGSFMEFKKGKAKYIEKYCNAHLGQYPVYSASTKGNNIIGEIDSFDHDRECLKITTNGHYAGTVEYIPKSKFSLNGDVGILYVKEKKYLKSIDYLYLEYALQKAREQYGFNWNNKPLEKDILAIEILIPVKRNRWDINEQRRISSKYTAYKKYILELNQCLDNVKRRFIKVD